MRFTVTIDEAPNGPPPAPGDQTPERYTYELEADSEVDAAVEARDRFERDTGRPPPDGAEIAVDFIG